MAGSSPALTGRRRCGNVTLYTAWYYLTGCTPRRPARRMMRSTDGSAPPAAPPRPACARVRTARRKPAACRPAPPDAAASLRFTTMRDDGAHHVVGRLVQDAPAGGGDLRHIARAGPFPGTASAAPGRTHRPARPVRRTAARSRRATRPPVSPVKRRPATSSAKPLRASQTSPSIVGAQLRLPRSASCTAGV